MKGKLKGIPFALIGIILAFAFVVDLPMFLLHANNVERFSALGNAELNTNARVRRLENLLITPTATPAASPTPAKMQFKQSSAPVVTRPATPTVQVK